MLRRNQGQAPYGFKWQGGCLLQVAEEVLVVQEIFRGMAESGAVSAVVKKLRTSGHMSRRGGAWSDVQVGRVLRCSAAIGKYEIGKNGSRTAEIVECDPIVSRDVWDRVQGLLASRRGTEATNSIPRPETLSGLIWCGCGQRMDWVADAAKFRCPGCRQSVMADPYPPHLPMTHAPFSIADPRKQIPFSQGGDPDPRDSEEGGIPQLSLQSRSSLR